MRSTVPRLITPQEAAIFYRGFRDLPKGAQLQGRQQGPLRLWASRLLLAS